MNDYDWFDDPWIDRKILSTEPGHDCEYQDDFRSSDICTNANTRLVEDPFDLEVNECSVYRWTCGECLQRRADEV